MEKEVKYASELIASFLYNNLPRLRVDQFKAEVESILINKLKLSIDAFSDPNMDVFYSKNVRKFKIVSTTESDEGILTTAAKSAYLEISEVLSCLDKSEFTIWMQSGQVSYKLGKDDDAVVYYRADSQLPMNNTCNNINNNNLSNQYYADEYNNKRMSNKSASNNSLEELNDFAPDSPTNLINAITKAIIEKQFFNDEYDLLNLRCTSPSQLSASDSSGYASSCSTLNGMSNTKTTPEQSTMNHLNYHWNGQGQTMPSHPPGFSPNYNVPNANMSALSMMEQQQNGGYTSAPPPINGSVPYMTAGMFAQTKFGTTKLRSQMCNGAAYGGHTYSQGGNNPGGQSNVAPPNGNTRFPPQSMENGCQYPMNENLNLCKPPPVPAGFENCAPNYGYNLNKPLMVWNNE